jgi:hypothetical protein
MGTLDGEPINGLAPRLCRGKNRVTSSQTTHFNGGSSLGLPSLRTLHRRPNTSSIGSRATF